MINKILFITLSNIGDVILTLPALDVLRQNFPQSAITVMAGPRPKELFERNPYIHKLIAYDKHAHLKNKIDLFNQLRKEKFELIVDLRNSFFGAFLPAKHKISFLPAFRKNIRHMRQRHLYRLYKIVGDPSKAAEKSLYISPSDEQYINNLLIKFQCLLKISHFKIGFAAPV